MGIYAATRAVVWIAAVTAPQDRDPARGIDWWSPVPTMRWDAGHYLHILLHGYPAAITDTTAFFPAYPLMARPLLGVMSPDAALVTVSHVAGLAGVALLYAWARRLTGSGTALRAVVLVCTWPLAMYFSTGYSEGLFFLCVMAALLALQSGHRWAAAVAAGLATATRPTGLAVAAIVLLWELRECIGRPLAGRLVRLVGLGLVSTSGLAAHELYLW